MKLTRESLDAMFQAAEANRDRELVLNVIYTCAQRGRADAIALVACVRSGLMTEDEMIGEWWREHPEWETAAREEAP